MNQFDEAAALFAGRAGVRVELLTHTDEMARASRLLGAVWHMEPGRSPMEPGLLTVLSHIGSYVSAAYQDDRMVGVCVGLLHQPSDAALHSHMAGVLPGVTGAGIGKALKYHQRAWAANAGLEQITWTFDPLVARNAFFNIHRLGCNVTRYLRNFYGHMDDGINVGIESDRMMVSWSVTQTQPPSGSGDLPDAVLQRSGTRPELRSVPPGARAARVEIPHDIEQLRVTDPGAAHSWRIELRLALTELCDDGWQITDFDRRGFYRLERKAP